MATVTKTIGSAGGRDYSTIEAWEADLDNTGIYGSGDTAIGSVYDDSAFTISATVSIAFANNPGIAEVLLEGFYGDWHYGVAGNGARLVGSGISGPMLSVDAVGGAAFGIRWLEINGNDQASAGIRISESGGAIENCLIHEIYAVSANTWGILCQSDATIQNCVIYQVGADGGFTSRGIAVTSVGTGMRILNNTVHYSAGGTGYGIVFVDIAGAVIRNNCATDATTACYVPSTVSNATCSHNLAGDATASGTGSLDNQNANDQFVSTSQGSENFFLLKTAAARNAGIDLGTTYPRNELDAWNWYRDADPVGSTWDMGAAEFVYHAQFVIKSVGATGRDYSTLEAWMAAFASFLNEGDTPIAEMYADSTFLQTSPLTIDEGAAPSPPQLVIRAAAGDRHDGLAGTGVVVVADSADMEMWVITSAVDVIVQYVELHGNDLAAKGLYVSATTAVNVNVENCLIHDIASTTPPALAVGLYKADADPNLQVTNCFIYNVASQGVVDGSAYGILAAVAPAGTHKILANTVFRIDSPSAVSGEVRGIKLTDSAGVSVKNNLVLGATATTVDADCFEPASFVTGAASHNGSSDGTSPGSGSLTSLAASSELTSTTSGSENLHLQSAADCLDAGTDLQADPFGVQFDIDGRDRDSQGDTWDIGADEHIV